MTQHTTVSYGTIVFHIAEHSVVGVWVERGSALVCNLFHPVSSMNGDSHGQ